MNKSKLQYWILAARPKTLPASVAPVIVACAMAYHAGKFQWIPAIICFTFALLTQIVSNFMNDYSDHKSGADRADRLGPDRAVSKGWIKPEVMLSAAIKLISFACLLGCGLIYYAGWEIIGVGIAVCIGAYAYSAGPYPLAYNGLGDVCVILFYGLVPTGFTYYVQTLEWNLPIIICGLATGIVSTNILVSNNFRDREQDRLSEKNTTIVLFGEEFGKWFYLINGLVAVMICGLLLFYGLNKAAILPVIYLIPHVLTWKEMCRIHKGKELNKILAKSAINTTIFGLLLSAGIILS